MERAAKLGDDLANHLFRLLRREVVEVRDLPQILGRMFQLPGINHRPGESAGRSVADVNAHVVGRQLEGIKPRMPARRDRDFVQPQVHLVGLVDERLRQRTGFGIERPLGDHPAQLGVGLGFVAFVGMIVQRRVEALRREFAQVAPAFDQQLPKLVEIVGTGQAASHPGDGEGDFSVNGS